MKHGRFENQPVKKSRKGAWIAVLLVLIVLLAGAAWGAKTLLVFVDGEPILKSTRELDLRDRSLTEEEYLALREKLPDCRILWNIPIGEQTYDSSSMVIAVKNFTQEDIARFSYFENLQGVDANAADCYDLILALQQALPDCEIRWSLKCAGQALSPTVTELTLEHTGVTAEELQWALTYLTEVTEVTLGDSGFTATEQLSLREAYPEIHFRWDVEAAGAVFSCQETSLSFAGEAVDAAALLDAAPLFDGVEELDLTGCGLKNQELLAISDAFGGAVIHSEITIFGVDCTTDDKALDFSGMRLTDTKELEEVLPLMHNLEKVDMCDCGISNEDMDTLNRKFPDVDIVWRVYFSEYSLRTDATAFCASNLPKNGYIAIKMNNEQLEPLKYCTKLEALDLGHMYYTDLSFLENMKELKYLILVDARFTDISVLASMENLFYLEIFKNTLDDLTPLLSCKNLKHLNIGYTNGFDISVLHQMTWLERLWYPGNPMTTAEKDALKAALPDTEIYCPTGDSDGSTGGGWREAEVYFEMRNVFNMFYQPGGTGTDALKNNG